MRLLCISINLLYGHAQNIVVMSGLVFLVATWNCQLSYKNRYAELLVLHFLPVLNSWLIVKMQPASVFSIGITVDVLQNWLNWFHFPLSTRYSDRLHDFSVIIRRCYKDVYVNSFFPRTARLWNSLPIECFPLTCDLNGFKSRIKRYLLTVGSF